MILGISAPSSLNTHCSPIPDLAKPTMNSFHWYEFAWTPVNKTDYESLPFRVVYTSLRKNRFTHVLQNKEWAYTQVMNFLSHLRLVWPYLKSAKPGVYHLKGIFLKVVNLENQGQYFVTLSLSLTLFNFLFFSSSVMETVKLLKLSHDIWCLGQSL